MEALHDQVSLPSALLVRDALGGPADPLDRCRHMTRRRRRVHGGGHLCPRRARRRVVEEKFAAEAELPSTDSRPGSEAT